MMEPVAWLVRHKRSSSAGTTFFAEPDFGNGENWDREDYDVMPLVRLSDEEARIAEITKWRDEWKDMATELKGLVEEWQARAEAAEALLKEAGKVLDKLEAVALKQPIAGGPDNVHLHNDWRGWWNKLFRPAMQEARSLASKVGGGE